MGESWKDIADEMNITEEQREEVRKLIDQYTKQDEKEKTKRVAVKVFEEFKRRYPD